jgi:hypothetical protein
VFFAHTTSVEINDSIEVFLEIHRANGEFVPVPSAGKPVWTITTPKHLNWRGQKAPKRSVTTAEAFLRDRESPEGYLVTEDMVFRAGWLRTAEGEVIEITEDTVVMRAAVE